MPHRLGRCMHCGKGVYGYQVYFLYPHLMHRQCYRPSQYIAATEMFAPDAKDSSNPALPDMRKKTKNLNKRSSHKNGESADIRF